MFWGEPSKDELKAHIRMFYSIFQDDVRCPSMGDEIPKSLGIRRHSADRGNAVNSAQKCFNVLYQIANGRSYDGSFRHSFNYKKNIEISLSEFLQSLKFTLGEPHFRGRVEEDESEDVDEFILNYWSMMGGVMRALLFSDRKLLESNVKEIRTHMSSAQRGIKVLLEQDYDDGPNADS